MSAGAIGLLNQYLAKETAQRVQRIVLYNIGIDHGGCPVNRLVELLVKEASLN